MLAKYLGSVVEQTMMGNIPVGEVAGVVVTSASHVDDVV